MKTEIVLVAMMMFGQIQGTDPKGILQWSSDPIFALSSEPTPNNAHEFAVREINKYMDWAASPRKIGEFYTTPRTTALTYIYTANGTAQQSFSIGHDGAIELNKITIEDALLLLYSNQATQQLEREREWDRLARAREEEAKSVPPVKLKGPKGESYRVKNLPRWSPDKTLLGDSACTLKRVRILETDNQKRDTVLHEMMHVATSCREDASLHRAIYALTPGILKMLQDNPDLVKYLTEKPTPTTEREHR